MESPWSIILIAPLCNQGLLSLFSVENLVALIVDFQSVMN